MSLGKEYLQQIQGALYEFEESVVRRENRSLFRSKIPLQQDVDHARQRVVDAVVKIVTAERMTQGK